SARVMKRAVAHLVPFIEQSKDGRARRSNGRIVMATVKGDVHDIGKNIVGVVLQCNNFEVIDLGVMVPCEKILETARREQADFIGLSGLITPSLDEMVHVAKEMQRQSFELPLLIGGATTSPAHTAVKIAPQYSGAVVYVKDASRSVGVCQTLATPAQRAAFVGKVSAEHERRREQHAAGRVKLPQASLAAARANRRAIDWSAHESRERVLTRLNFLRQQKAKPDGQPHECLADYVAPKSSGLRDYFGAFAVAAGEGIEEQLARFAREHDDYSGILLKALADRFA